MTHTKTAYALIDHFNAVSSRPGVAAHEVFVAAHHLTTWLKSDADRTVCKLLMDEIQDIAPDMLTQKQDKTFTHFVDSLVDVAGTEKDESVRGKAIRSLNHIAIAIEDEDATRAQNIKAQVKHFTTSQNVLN